jgi:hypothetical protein
MDTKKCSRCHQEKPFSDFHKRSDKAIGVQSHCKVCQKERKQKYLSTPSGQQKTREYAKKSYQLNKERSLEENKKWRQENKERRKEYLRIYDAKRRPIMVMYPILSVNERNKRRYHSDAKTRIGKLISIGIRVSLKSRKENSHWETLVGYTYQQLENRLQSTLPEGYIWDDYISGKTDLQIDHYIPVTAFNFSSYKDLDFKRCWELNNLRLLPKIENIKKSNKLNEPFQPSLEISC